MNFQFLFLFYISKGIHREDLIQVENRHRENFRKMVESMKKTLKQYTDDEYSKPPISYLKEFKEGKLLNYHFFFFLIYENHFQDKIS